MEQRGAQQKVAGHLHRRNVLAARFIQAILRQPSPFFELSADRMKKPRSAQDVKCVLSFTGSPRKQQRALVRLADFLRAP